MLVCVIDEILYSVYWCMIKTSLCLHAGFYYNNNIIDMSSNNKKFR